MFNDNTEYAIQIEASFLSIYKYHNIFYEYNANAKIDYIFFKFIR